MNKEYEDFIKKFGERKYTAYTAEYKRTARKTNSRNIKATNKEIFQVILKEVLKGTDKKGEIFLVKGEKISTKNGKAFVYDFVENKRFSFIYRSNLEKIYYLNTFEIKTTTRDFCIVSCTYESKLENTIAGFNGMLANWKFKKKANEVTKNTLEVIKNKVENIKRS